MPQIGKVRRRVAEINALVHDAPVITTYSGKRQWQPDVIQVTYVQVHGSDWMIREIKLAGPRVLKNGVSEKERLDDRWHMTNGWAEGGIHATIDETPDERFFGKPPPDWALDWARDQVAWIR